MNHETPIALPTVAYEGKRWYFDARLREIRNIRDPHEFQRLDDFELAYFAELVQSKRAEA